MLIIFYQKFDDQFQSHRLTMWDFGSMFLLRNVTENRLYFSFGFGFIALCFNLYTWTMPTNGFEYRTCKKKFSATKLLFSVTSEWNNWVDGKMINCTEIRKLIQICDEYQVRSQEFPENFGQFLPPPHSQRKNVWNFFRNFIEGTLLSKTPLKNLVFNC